MAFNPKVNEELVIDDTTYRFAEHPAATGIPYGQEGRAGIVYQVLAEGERRALKVFKSRYQAPALVTLADRLEAFSRLPGLRVCQRSVITARRHIQLVREHPDLAYAVLMPWVEGPTWMEVLLEKQEFTPEQSLGLARALVEVLAGMEERGLAHCDLSASNLMLPALAEGSMADSQYPVELVDVEQMYGEELRRPEYVPSGSAGYAHVMAPEGVWSIYADRFAGALLISEILGWCDPRVREASWGESYLTPGEIQKPSARYDLLLGVLRARWGEGVARLLERAWNSDTMADCATCGHWLAALPDVAPPFQMPVEVDKPNGSMMQREATASKVSAPIVETGQAQSLLDKARLLEEKGDLRGALGAYREAQLSVPADSGTAMELALIVGRLERESDAGEALHSGGAGAGLRSEADDAGLENLFDSGVTAYSQGEWASAKELLDEVVRRRPGYERHGQKAAALLAAAEQQIAATRSTGSMPEVVAVEPEAAGAGAIETRPVAQVPLAVTPGAEATRKVAVSGKPSWPRFAVPALLLLLLLVFGSITVVLIQSQSSIGGQNQISPTVGAGAAQSSTASAQEAQGTGEIGPEGTAQIPPIATNELTPIETAQIPPIATNEPTPISVGAGISPSVVPQASATASPAATATTTVQAPGASTEQVQIPPLVSLGEWPRYEQGSSGPDIATIQCLLRAHGYDISVDGIFGAETNNTVRDFQETRGIDVDGIVGPVTWDQLIVLVQNGDNGAQVEAAQYQLNKYGYNLDVDGIFGRDTVNAVRDFQSIRGLDVDGVIGPATWFALVSGR